MPKQTFFNLAEEKRQHILQVAIGEFADKGYREASISRMVAVAGIAKGSFYQYFEGKEDLYEYIFDQIAGKKSETYRKEMDSLKELTLTEFLRKVFLIQLREFQNAPELLKIGMDFARDLPHPVNQRIMSKYQGMASTYFTPFIRMEKERGELDPEVDEDLLNFMLVSMGQYISYLLTTGQLETMSEEVLHQLVDRLEYILTNGIYGKGR